MKKNRLVITLRGTIRKNDIESIYTDIRFGVRDLQPGFDVITDLRDSRIGYLAGVTTFLKIQSFLADSGVGRVVRISGSAGTIFQQLRQITAGGSYTPVYVESFEEAEAYLAKKN